MAGLIQKRVSKSQQLHFLLRITTVRSSVIELKMQVSAIVVIVN